MASVGTIAKENLMAKFIEAAGADYAGTQDKKYYFWSEENGEKMQIAVTMTKTKNPINFEGSSGGNLDFSEPKKESVTMGADEEAKIQQIMIDLNLGG